MYTWQSKIIFENKYKVGPQGKKLQWTVPRMFWTRETGACSGHLLFMPDWHPLSILLKTTTPFSLGNHLFILYLKLLSFASNVHQIFQIFLICIILGDVEETIGKWKVLIVLGWLIWRDETLAIILPCGETIHEKEAKTETSWTKGWREADFWHHLGTSVHPCLKPTHVLANKFLCV